MSITSPASPPPSARSGSPVHLHRDDLFLYERAVEQGRLFGIARRAAAADRLVLHAGRGDRLRRVRGAPAPHAGPLPRRRVPRGRRARRHAASTCSSATRCLPGRSAGPTCPAATTRRSSGRSGPCCSRSATMRGCIPGTARTRPSAASAAPTRSCRRSERSVARLLDLPASTRPTLQPVTGPIEVRRATRACRSRRCRWCSRGR